MSSLPGASQFIRYLPKQTLASTISGNDKDMFVFTKFKADPRFVGKWLRCTKHYEKEIDAKGLEYKLKQTLVKYERDKNKKGRSKGKLHYMTLNKNGSGTHFWCGDMIIDNIEGEARRMRLQKANGKTFLLLELGNFPEKAGKGWHCGYMVYVKQ
jgi:hypothetical protein